MKSLLLVLISIFIVSHVNGQKKSDVISIGRVMGSGDGYYVKIIGANKKSLSQSPSYGDVKTENYIIGTKPIKLIKDFIDNNCDNVDHLTETTINLFIIKVTTKRGTKTCYIKEDKALAKSYFERLVKILKKSPYKTECRKLITDIESTIRSLNG